MANAEQPEEGRKHPPRIEEEKKEGPLCPKKKTKRRKRNGLSGPLRTGRGKGLSLEKKKGRETYADKPKKRQFFRRKGGELLEGGREEKKGKSRLEDWEGGEKGGKCPPLKKERGGECVGEKKGVTMQKSSKN